MAVITGLLFSWFSAWLVGTVRLNVGGLVKGFSGLGETALILVTAVSKHM